MKKKVKSIDETLYLTDNSNNAQRLINGIKELKDGEGTQRDLIEESIPKQRWWKRKTNRYYLFFFVLVFISSSLI